MYQFGSRFDSMMSIDRPLFLQTRHRALHKIVEHSPTKYLIQPSCKIKETFNDVEKKPSHRPSKHCCFVQDASDYQLLVDSLEYAPHESRESLKRALSTSHLLDLRDDLLRPTI